jgi:hypothetical protein
MGLAISDAIGLSMPRVADEQRLPFGVEVPGAATRRVIAELEGGKGEPFDTREELLEHPRIRHRAQRSRRTPACVPRRLTPPSLRGA